MPDKKWFELGYTRTYPYDDPNVNWKKIGEIPWFAALVWADQVCPRANVGSGAVGTLKMKIDLIRSGGSSEYEALTFFNWWLNKLLLVGEEFKIFGHAVALYHHDGAMGVLIG